MSAENYINRELSWLEFNQRVLAEAQDRRNPLIERLKFLTIVSSNLDEFFMVRIASLRDQIIAGFKHKKPKDLSPRVAMSHIAVRAQRMVVDQYLCYNHSIKRGLKKEKILLLNSDELTPEQLDYINSFFNQNVSPVLTPMVVDHSRPFPLILGKSLNIALLVAGKNENKDCFFATVQVPAVLERLVEIPSAGESKTLILLEDVIKMNLAKIFCGYRIINPTCYRITRNADLNFDEEGAEDLLEAIEQSIRERKWGSVIRLEIEKGVDERLLAQLLLELEISEEEVYKISGPIDLRFFEAITSMTSFEHVQYPPIQSQYHSSFLNEDLFHTIAQKDILLHHPYHSFLPVIKFIQQAATDPQVLAIKQTLYRVSGNSPIVEALAKAAENGKQVTVLVELKARFDEQKNIQWAKRLEKAGCHVIYGLVGLKTHCKILLVVRREEDGIKRYMHLGTGNYNDVTAGFYTDLGLFTANPYFGADASNLFNMISGLSQPSDMYRLVIAPTDLRNEFLRLIAREAANAKEGKKAQIVAKLNSLVDHQIIDALYHASSAGVSIQLIVRGICSLRPRIPGVSDNISVRSIVGRLLEHSRIYYFHNDGAESIYLSSADLMERNLDRRVEVLFPLDDEQVKEEVKIILSISLSDTAKSWKLNSDGTYTRHKKRGTKVFNSQEMFFQRVHQKEQLRELNKKTITFLPIDSIK